MEEENIVDWFDPYDIKHIRAWENLCKTGCWPEGFVPDGMVFPDVWHVSVAAKMAKCWVKHIENNESNKGEAFFNDMG